MLTAVFSKSIKQQLMYRSEFLLSILGNMVFIYIQISIWRALLANGAGGGITSLAGMVTYVIVSYILRQASRTHFTRTFAVKVNRGDIAIDLIRPVSMKNMLIAEQLSENVCNIVLTGLPVAILAGFIWKIEFVISPLQLLVFGISAVLAVALSLYMDYISGMLVFWTRNEDYTRQMHSGLMTIFAGSAIPLWFYPEWLRAIGSFLPYRLIAFEPVQIFLGKVDLQGSLTIVLHQMLWLAVIYAIERLIWSRMKNNVFVQGG